MMEDDSVPFRATGWVSDVSPCSTSSDSVSSYLNSVTHTVREAHCGWAFKEEGCVQNVMLNLDTADKELGLVRATCAPSMKSAWPSSARDVFALLLGAVADHDESIVLGAHVLMAVLASVLCISAVYTLIRESRLANKRKKQKSEQLTKENEAFALACSPDIREHEECLKLVEKNHLDVNSNIDGLGLSIFMAACLSKKEAVVRRMLQNGADVKVRSRSGDSPLYLATYRKLTTDDCDDTGLLKHLIELGCGVNEQNEAGLTPLHLCAWKGNPNLISFLLSHGA
ncbi:hypothetical protein ISCGN_026361 [Ixodes scapularis]